MILFNAMQVFTTSEEVFHLAVHLVQMAIVLAALYRLAKNYQAIRSRFNLGLVVFGIAMLLQIALFLVFFTIAEEEVFHFAGEIIEVIALLVFFYLISK